MASRKSNAGAAVLDFDEPEQPRRRARRVEPEGPVRSSRFDDFDDFSAETAEPAAGRRKSGRVRKGWLRWPEATWARWVIAGAAVALLGALAAGGWMVRRSFLRDPRFKIASDANVDVTGNSHVSADDIRAVFAGDVGRNIFAVPLAERQKELEALPWVQHATLERLLPDRLAVRVVERTPVAFVEDHGAIEMVDSEGVVLDMPAAEQSHYSFPVLSGVSADVPQSTRAARMGIYADFVKQVDSGGAKVTSRISELDLNDPEDVTATIEEDGVPLTVHFGDGNYLARYKTYQAHLGEWRQQYSDLAVVDLRNYPQVTLRMAKGEASKSQQAGKSQEAASGSTADAPAAVPAQSAEADSSASLRNDNTGEARVAGETKVAPVAAKKPAKPAVKSVKASGKGGLGKAGPAKAGSAKAAKPGLVHTASSGGAHGPTAAQGGGVKSSSDAVAVFNSAAPQAPAHKMVLRMPASDRGSTQAGAQ